MSNDHLTRIPDAGVTEQLVIFADQAVLDAINPGERVLDVGCGRGIFTERIAEKGCEVTGIDVIPKEIQAAQAGAPNAEYVCMAAENLDKLNKKYDVVVSRFCFHHLDFPQAAAGICSSLERDGRLFAVDCYRDFWSLRGRAYVLWSALRLLGPRTFSRVMLRAGYFFQPDRFEHVRSDIRRLREQKRYTLAQVRSFYGEVFPGCVVDTLGCAFTLSWRCASASR